VGRKNVEIVQVSLGLKLHSDGLKLDAQTTYLLAPQLLLFAFVSLLPNILKKVPLANLEIVLFIHGGAADRHTEM
jgi:hypothetical protein